MIEQLRQEELAPVGAIKSHKKFWKMSQQQAEEKAEVKSKCNIIWCRIYDMKTPEQLNEDDMATSEEDCSQATIERKRYEVRNLSTYILSMLTVSSENSCGSNGRIWIPV